MYINKACRLCLKTSNTIYETAHAISKDILGSLPIKINLNISENPITCLKCTEDLKKCLDLKSLCVHTEENITNFLKLNNISKVNMEQVYFNVVNNFNLTDKKICRFCMKPSEDFCILSKLYKDGNFIDKLEKFLPEVSLNVISDPISCITCLHFLNFYFDFLKSCQEIEEYIEIYQNSESAITRAKVDFNDTAESFLKLKSEKCVYKIENTAFDIKEEIDDGTVWSEEKLLDMNSLEVNVDKKCVKNETDIRHAEMNLPNRDEINILEKISCTKCNYITKCKSAMKNHMKSHRTLMMYQCADCPYESVRKDSLKDHIICKHKDPSQVQMYKCASCSFETKIKGSLKRHIIYRHKNSNEVRIYQCANCSYRAKTKDDFKKHIIYKHKDPTETKKYKCTNCSYAAKRKHILNEHIIYKHTDYSKLQMFRCNYCPYEAKTKGAFKRHVINKHNPSELRMYKCPSCPYESKENNKLKRHTIYKHTDSSELKMYKCTDCPYEAKTRDDFKKHVLNKHKDPNESNIYKCRDCSYAAKRKSTLDNHIIYKHTDYNELNISKFDNCLYEAKAKVDYKKHIINKHMDRSEVKNI